MTFEMDAGVGALVQERAFVDLSAYRKVRVTGADAGAWLGDLVTADVASLVPGRSRRSLLLTPTGTIRADFQVALDEAGYVLIQAPDQPDHVGLLLTPYILSSEVDLHDATNELALFSVPGAAAALVGRPGIAPSVLGPGIDLIPTTGKAAWRDEDMFVKRALEEADADAVESWRIARGVARMGPDFDQSSLPADAGLESTIDRTKGCFLGQESVARVANLGHARSVLRPVGCEAAIVEGDAVTMGGVQVGVITSATDWIDGGWRALARVTWATREAELTGPHGHPLTPVRPSD